jgi:hypothetical protein
MCSGEAVSWGAVLDEAFPYLASAIGCTQFMTATYRCRKYSNIPLAIASAIRFWYSGVPSLGLSS